MLDKKESTTQLNVAVMRVICSAEFEAFQIKMAKEMRNTRFAICLMSVRFRIAPTGALESINQIEIEPAEQHRKCVLMALIFWCVFMLAEYPFLIELILIRSEKVFQHLMEYLVSLVKRMSIPQRLYQVQFFFHCRLSKISRIWRCSDALFPSYSSLYYRYDARCGADESKTSLLCVKQVSKTNKASD